MSGIRVIVLEPNATVKTMADGVQDGSVRTAVDAAVAAYKELDSDGKVEVIKYSEDFDDAVVQAVGLASDGKCLVVIVTDFQGNDPDRAEQQLASLADDFFVLVPVSNRGHNVVWAQQLDDDSPAAGQIDVIDVKGLQDRSVAYAEVGPWAGTAA